MEIVDYKIVCENVLEIEPTVKGLLRQGWQLLGPAQATRQFHEEEGYAVWQTMVKYGKVAPRARRQRG